MTEELPSLIFCNILFVNIPPQICVYILTVLEVGTISFILAGDFICSKSVSADTVGSFFFFQCFIGELNSVMFGLILLKQLSAGEPIQAVVLFVNLFLFFFFLEGVKPFYKDNILALI